MEMIKKFSHPTMSGPYVHISFQGLPPLTQLWPAQAGRFIWRKGERKNEKNDDDRTICMSYPSTQTRAFFHH